MMDLNPVWITLKLASVTTLLLLVFGTPLAWWLTFSKSPLKFFVNTIVALPLVLPPTVLGFYLLVLLGPEGMVGRLSHALGLGYFTFSFTGLVIGSFVFSLPFVVQPIQSSFESMGRRPLEVAATLGLHGGRRFRRIVLPMCRAGFFTATILGFAHTVGEFGVVLMLGGNIPGKTKVISVSIYESVESLDFANAHRWSAALMIFSFLVLALVYWRRKPLRFGL